MEPDPGRALDRALGLGGEMLVACGSIYLVGEVRTRVRGGGFAEMLTSGPVGGEGRLARGA